MTTKYTVEQIMKWNPCYTRHCVEYLIGDSISAVELANLDIHIKDRVWVLIRMLYDIRGKDAVADFAGNCALRAYYNAFNKGRNTATYYANAARTASSATDAAYFAAATAAASNYDDDDDDDDYEYIYKSERQWQLDYLVNAING